MRISRPVLVSRTNASATSAETRELAQGRRETGRLAAGFSKVAREIDAADGKHRSKAKEDTDAKRDGEGEREHASIERDTIEVHKEGGRAARMA